MSDMGIVEPIWHVIEVVLIVHFGRRAWINRWGFREIRWARQKDRLRDRVVADQRRRISTLNRRPELN
jgi:hypothetical protein